jgi:hypothetical protein
MPSILGRINFATEGNFIRNFIRNLIKIFQVNGRSGFINLSSADFQPSAGNQKIGDL